MRAELLKEGIIWRIGNGDNVKIWEDPWLPRESTRKLATPRRSCLLTRVNQLIDPVTGEWDEQLICDNFWPEDAAEILRIPINVHMEDWPAWHFDPKGLCSVKSAYKVAVTRRDALTGRDGSTSGNPNGGGDEFKWHKIWQLKVPNKVKMFVWRLAHNSLPVRRNVANRGINIDTMCPVCRRFDEDCGHLFFKCKFAKLCWRLMNMEHIRAELVNCQSGVETINKIWGFDRHIQLKVIVFLWRWWSARNKVNEGERMQSANEICSSVCYFLMEVQKLERNAMKQTAVARYSWKPPPADIYKINSDGSFDPSSRSGGWGFVVRDSSGEVLAAGAGNITYAASSLQAEAIAVYKSILQAARLGMTRIILEMDATVLASALKSCCVDRSAIGGLVYQIRDIMCDDFSCCTVSVCNRSCNKVADCLAFHGAYVLSSGFEVFLSQAPDYVKDLVLGHLPNIV